MALARELEMDARLDETDSDAPLAPAPTPEIVVDPTVEVNREVPEVPTATMAEVVMAEEEAVEEADAAPPAP